MAAAMQWAPCWPAPPLVAPRCCPVLCCPQGDIYVARAPGRLDVMGGIADYSGSLVLQVGCVSCEVLLVANGRTTWGCLRRMWPHADVSLLAPSTRTPFTSCCVQLPLAEACHVAVQRHAASGAAAAAAAAAAEPAMLRIVSFASEGSHRSPSFELPLAELVSEEPSAG